MVDYIKYPKTIDFSENNCGAIIQGSNLYINAGTYGSFSLNLPPFLGIAAGDYKFPDLINGDFVTIKAVSTPDDSGYQIKSGKSGAELAKELRQNYILQKGFDIWVDGNSIKFKSKLKGDYDIINNAVAPSVPGGANISNKINGVAPIINSGYRLFFTVSIEKDYLSDIFETYEFFGDPDDDVKLPVHLSFLKSFFIERDLPQVNQSGSTLCTNTIKRYRIAAAEFYDDVTRKLYETQIFFMLRGKMKPDDYVGVDLPNLITSTLMYLKHSGTEIKTTNETQQYLYFMAPRANSHQHHIKTEKFFNDGTANEIVNVNVIASMSDYEIVLIPVGFKALGFDLHAKKNNIYKYQVGLYDSTGKQLGMTMTYFVRKWTDHDLIFLYENRFGVFDTLIATGETEREHVISNELSEKYLPLDYATTDSQFISENKDDYPVFKANTGAYTLDMALEMEAFLTANHFYQVLGNKYRRCELLKSTKTVSDTLENLYSIDFEYRYSLK